MKSKTWFKMQEIQGCGIKLIPKIAWRTMFAIMKNSITDERFTSKMTQLTRNGLMMQLMLPFKGWTKTNLLNLMSLTTRWKNWRPTTMSLLLASCTKGVLLNLVELHHMEVVLVIKMFQQVQDLKLRKSTNVWWFFSHFHGVKKMWTILYNLLNMLTIKKKVKAH